jgi:hypothetical protein
MLLRVSSGGTYDNTSVRDWTTGSHINFGEIPDLSAAGTIITNADQGAVLSWSYLDANWQEQRGMATTAGTSVNLVSAPALAGQNGAVDVVLQAQDGTFVGTAWVGDPDNPTPSMVAFDQSGSVRSSVPGYQPKIATANDGVIATGESGAAVTFDQNGNATGQMASLATYSWFGYAYQSADSSEQYLVSPLDFGLSFAAFAGGGPSDNGADVKLVQAKVFLPIEVADLSKGPPLTAAFAKQFSSAAKSTIVALEPLPFAKATAWRFTEFLKVTNMIIAFVGHAITTTREPPFHAQGLAFSDALLQPGESPVPNGFVAKAKVVFLGVCGIDPPPSGSFISQWHLSQTYPQALIVPQYTSTNTTNQQMDLADAARDLGTFLDQLGTPPGAGGFKGYNVGQAVSSLNGRISNDGGLTHAWQVTPNEGNNVNFFATPAH